MHICNFINSTEISQFADNFLLYYTFNNKERDLNNAETKLYKAILTLKNRLGDVELFMRQPKSSIFFFTNKCKISDVNISIDGKLIKVVKIAKYLGLI